jgi:hypothetical protein
MNAVHSVEDMTEISSCDPTHSLPANIVLVYSNAGAKPCYLVALGATP